MIAVDALMDDQINNLNILGDCASLRLGGEEADTYGGLEGATTFFFFVRDFFFFF